MEEQDKEESPPVSGVRPALGRAGPLGIVPLVLGGVWARAVRMREREDRAAVRAFLRRVRDWEEAWEARRVGPMQRPDSLDLFLGEWGLD